MGADCSNVRVNMFYRDSGASHRSVNSAEGPGSAEYVALAWGDQPAIDSAALYFHSPEGSWYFLLQLP